MVLSCGLGAYALPEFNNFLKNKPANVEVVKFPCISKIDTLHMLKAFQLGADGVIVAGCAEDETNGCPFQQTLYWAGRRVGRVKSILKDVGLEEERLALCSFKPEETADFGRAAGAALQKIEELGKR